MRKWRGTLGIASAAAVRKTAPLLLIAGGVGLAVSVSARPEPSPVVNGLPFSRSYPYDEISNEARGARLDFDSLGRIAVIRNGSYVVLNDTTWIDIADKVTSGSTSIQVVRDADGVSYYGAIGSWGTVDYSAEGKLRPVSLLPPEHPKWVPVTNFSEIIPDSKGVFFSGWNGVVYWDRATKTHSFFEVPQVSRMFAVKDKVFVCSLTEGIKYIDRQSRSLRPADVAGSEGQVIERAVKMSDDRVLVSTMARHLMVFDGRRLTLWPSELGNEAMGSISGLERLIDGNIAVAIDGQGVFILSDTGKILISLTSPEYHRTMGLAMREAGVLWIATERGVEKVLYNSPVTVVDQRLGVPVLWPQVVRWKDRTIIASNGRLYETIPQPGRVTADFQLISTQPVDGAWGIAAQGDHMLIGNASGVYARESDGSFTPVLLGINVDRLVMVNEALCYVIGTNEITALGWTRGRWSECAARVAGVGYPALVHAAKASAWIELGPNRVARVLLSGGQLHTRIFDSFPWVTPEWINVSVIGDTIALSGPASGRIFFDEKTETLGKAPQLERLFNEAPHWIFRLRKDAEGTLWASYEQGVFKITPENNRYRFDLTSLDIVTDRVPLIQIPEGTDVWFSSKQSMYHVDRSHGFELKPTPIKPMLVSIIDGRSGREIFGAMHSRRPLSRLPFEQNSLTFRFFADSYTLMRSPAYEFRINGQPIVSTDSLLTLTDLREGSYRLDARLVDARGPVGESVSVDFAIEPPWYRTWYTYACYATAGTLGVLGVISWALRRTKSQNLTLERLVHERTEELRTTMHRLEEETRNTATLAERNRLAGEIHDSLQQGLSGLILQLEATLKLPSISTDVRTRLSVARNMVSFTRQEVQNAVWDLESPLLENDDLGDALNKMAALISSGGPRIELTITGTRRRLSSSATHHLLRIAQEAITNSVRHGAANRITVVLNYADDSVSLAVTDDGCGFLPQQILTREFGHFGLRGLRGRADKINGDIKIISEPGRGASIQIRVPISL
jgi:signal transduction histidine kinase